MKVRIFIVIAIALLLTTLVVVEQIYMINTMQFLQTESAVIKNEIFDKNDINNAFLIEKINNFDNSWRKKESLLCLLVNHKDMEKVGEQIEKLKVLIIQNDKKQAENEAELLCYYVDSYEHFVSLSFQNIF